MKFKYKVLLATILLTIGAITLQGVMQFMQAYKVQIFVKRNDQQSYYGLYSEAKADYLTCAEELEQIKKARNQANADIME